MLQKFLGAIVILLFGACCLLPSAGLAAVGFAPSTGIWFSATTIIPNQSIWIFSVIINNEYYSLNGVVGFYDDNNELIDSVAVIGLRKEQAMQIKVLWTPEVGEHALSARFIKALAVDANGKEQLLAIDSLNSVAGVPLNVGGTMVGNTTVSIGQPGATTSTQPASSATIAPDVTGQTMVSVKKQGESIVITPSIRTSSEQNSNTMATGTIGTVEDLFAKNREALDKARSIAETVTSTAAKISAVYERSKAAIDQGQEYYTKGQRFIAPIKAAAQKVKPAWDKIFNHNNPKRLAIIGGGVVVAAWLVRKSRRRGRQYFDR